MYYSAADYGADPDFEGPFYRQQFSEIPDRQQVAMSVRACLAGAPYPTEEAAQFCTWAQQAGLTRETVELLLAELVTPGQTAFSGNLIARIEAERSGVDRTPQTEIHPAMILGGLALLAYVLFSDTGKPKRAAAPALAVGPLPLPPPLIVPEPAPIRATAAAPAKPIIEVVEEIKVPDLILQAPSGQIVGGLG